MPSSHNLSRLDPERGALVFAQGGDHALRARVAGRAGREQVTMRRIAGASYCPLPLSQAVLVEKGKHKVY